mmetsp:Transcript_52851/g.114249  ORF Transcript_52851/g.114249 Transcript_52851/m.114249 type:complete len:336 (-) Transcript_52851:165-1172(-)
MALEDPVIPSVAPLFAPRSVEDPVTPLFVPRRVASLSPDPLATPQHRFWAARLAVAGGWPGCERPKQERDSLRSRSKEGRPGSRRHRRWTRSQELTGSLRRAMTACGEDAEGVDRAKQEAGVEALGEVRPSAFYKLLEHEGPARALDAWAASEAARPERKSSPRRRELREEDKAVAVRRAFGDIWRFVRNDVTSRGLLEQLENGAIRAFGTGASAESIANSEVQDEAEPKADQGEEKSAVSDEPWLLRWDGSTLLTEAGAPPAAKLEVMGLGPHHRKVAHQLARALDLLSESHLGGPGGTEKVLALRPPRGRRSCGLGSGWAAPLSVTRVLAAVA